MCVGNKMEKQKLARYARDLVDGYLSIESRISKLTDKFYSYDRDFQKERRLLDDAIDKENKSLELQYSQLDKALKACGWQYQPACFINEYTENKVNALKLINYFHP